MNELSQARQNVLKEVLGIVFEHLVVVGVEFPDEPAAVWSVLVLWHTVCNNPQHGHDK